MNTDDSIHVACAITNEHSFAKTGESQISPIRPSLVDQTESENDSDFVDNIVEHQDPVKLNSHHDSPIGVGARGDVALPFLSTSVPGRFPSFPLLSGTSSSEVALASNAGREVAVPVSYPNTPPRAPSLNDQCLFTGFNVTDGASAGLLRGIRSPGNESPKRDVGNNFFTATGALSNFAVDSDCISVPSRRYQELVESGATQIKHITHLNQLLVESHAQQEFLVYKREEMATYCKKKCIELKELFESKLDEQQLQSDSALQALRINLVSANRSGEAVDGERRKAIKAAEAAIEERDKVVLEIRALRLGMHIGVPTYKVFTPEEQDSGESNKFGSAGSHAIGAVKHGQEFAAATSVGTFVPTDPSVTYQHVGRNAAATSVGPSNCKTVGESPFSFSKSYACHANADTMDDFFSKLVVKGGSSTMLHPTATAQSFGPSIVNKGASTSYMTVTEPNP